MDAKEETVNGTAGGDSIAVSAPEIHQLTAENARKLASGQLITGPDSVVRELVENSIDAGAKHITVNIEPDFSFIQVKDDGCGINAAGMELVASGNCTSKITTFEDIYSDHLHTHGFRGEALHLIGAAAGSVEIVSRSAADATGTVVLFENGKRTASKSHVCAVGTNIKVKRLFANFPVRLKELKRKAAALFLRIHRLLLSYALLRPHIKLESKRPAIRKGSSESQFESLRALNTNSFMQQLEAVEYRSQPQPNAAGEYIITGLWPKPNADYAVPNVNRPTNDRLFCFLNNRCIEHRGLSRVITRCWRVHARQSSPHATAKRFPFVVLNITAPASSFDLNISPDKRDVLLKKREEIEQHLKLALIPNELAAYDRKADRTASAAATATAATGDADDDDDADGERDDALGTSTQADTDESAPELGSAAAPAPADDSEEISAAELEQRREAMRQASAARAAAEQLAIDARILAGGNAAPPPPSQKPTPAPTPVAPPANSALHLDAKHLQPIAASAAVAATPKRKATIDLVLDDDNDDDVDVVSAQTTPPAAATAPTVDGESKSGNSSPAKRLRTNKNVNGSAVLPNDDTVPPALESVTPASQPSATQPASDTATTDAAAAATAAAGTKANPLKLRSGLRRETGEDILTTKTRKKKKPAPDAADGPLYEQKQLNLQPASTAKFYDDRTARFDMSRAQHQLTALDERKRSGKPARADLPALRVIGKFYVHENNPAPFFVLQHTPPLAAASDSSSAAATAAASNRLKSNGNRLFVFDPTRAEEANCYSQLRSSHVLAHSELDTAIDIGDSSFTGISDQEKHTLMHVYQHAQYQQTVTATATAATSAAAAADAQSGVVIIDGIKSYTLAHIFRMNAFHMRVRAHMSAPNQSILELHAVPRDQSLTIDDFTALMRQLFGVKSVLNYFSTHPTPFHTGAGPTIPVVEWKIYRPPRILHLLQSEANKLCAATLIPFNLPPARVDRQCAALAVAPQLNAGVTPSTVTSTPLAVKHFTCTHNKPYLVSLLASTPLFGVPAAHASI